MDFDSGSGSSTDEDQHETEIKHRQSAECGERMSFQRIYQQLGAPTVLYHQPPTYPPAFDEWHALDRVYSDMKQHINQRFQAQNYAKFAWYNANPHHRSLGTTNASEKLHNDLFQGNILPSLQKDRSRMLRRKRRSTGSSKKILQQVAQYDHPYVTAKYNEAGDRPLWIPEHAKMSLVYSDLRMFGANPSYLASFGDDAINVLLENRQRGKNTKRASIQRRVLSDSEHGNCLLCLPCPCPPCCSNESNGMRWCLFHPVGAAMDRLAVSNILFPFDSNIASREYSSGDATQNSMWVGEDSEESVTNEIYIGDTVFGISQCGEWGSSTIPGRFVVRTASFISVINVKPVIGGQPSEDQSASEFDACWGDYCISEQTRIDLRSVARNSISYFPTAVACHPKYGGSFTPAMFAAVSRSNRSTFNTIHHITARDSDCKVTPHHINNLKRITHLDFMQSHPACLWSAAKSFVNPALTRTIRAKSCLFGHGTSLFSIDLRTNTAVFQWSPSADDHLTEGINSISDIVTDWRNNYSVWVSSISAGKVWEIDGRMPCKTLNSWMLPLSCDEPGAKLPQTGILGSGCLLHSPIACFDSLDIKAAIPMLCVSKNRANFGLHVYQLPEERLQFGLSPPECIAKPGLRFTSKTRFATSSVFALPEVSEDVMTCGLATLRAPVSRFLSARSCMDIGMTEEQARTSQILCALTMTNNGTVYSHALLELDDCALDTQGGPNLPVGAQAIALPVQHHESKTNNEIALRLQLSNDYPLQSGVHMPRPETISGDTILDLTKEKPKIDRRRKKLKISNDAPNASATDDNSTSEKSSEDDSGDDEKECHDQVAFPDLAEAIRSRSLFALNGERWLKDPSANPPDQLEELAKNEDLYEPRSGKRRKPRSIERTDVTNQILDFSEDLWEDLEKREGAEEDEDMYQNIDEDLQVIKEEDGSSSEDLSESDSSSDGR